MTTCPGSRKLHIVLQYPRWLFGGLVGAIMCLETEAPLSLMTMDSQEPSMAAHVVSECVSYRVCKATSLSPFMSSSDNLSRAASTAQPDPLLLRCASSGWCPALPALKNEQLAPKPHRKRGCGPRSSPAAALLRRTLSLGGPAACSACRDTTNMWFPACGRYFLV